MCSGSNLARATVRLSSTHHCSPLQQTMSIGEKHSLLPETATDRSTRARARARAPRGAAWPLKLVCAAVAAVTVCHYTAWTRIHKHPGRAGHRIDGRRGWGGFPRTDDPFHFLPCTNATAPPALDDEHPVKSWLRLYDDNPTHWSWGSNLTTTDGLYLCGWLDVPLDYTNSSDLRIARLAVTKFQLSPHGASKRILVVEPGGPGGSGTNLVWRKAEMFSSMYTNSTFDVVGWDPRGVNASLPSISCFPWDADRDRYSLLTGTFLRQVSANPRQAMLTTDAMNQAIFEACKRKYDDVPTLLTTAFVSRDLDRLRKALGQDKLDGYFVSYGTGIGQTYVNMFPQHVGRLMLDGTEYVRDQRLMGGFGWAALDNITASFHDGFLGECVSAGPQQCRLAEPLPGKTILPTKQDLIEAMDDLFERLVTRPIPGYTKASGPMLITYSQVVSLIYSALYAASSWPPLAAALQELLSGDSGLISHYIDDVWEYDPTLPPPTSHSSDELGMLVICSDQYDSPLPAGYDVATNGEQWYLDLWADMVRQSEIGGDGRFFDILACRQWNSTFAPPKQVYRGDLNHTLSNPVLLIAETYDPATPLRNGRRLLAEMGTHNARLIALDAFSHSSRDLSRCAIGMMREYMMKGTLPSNAETRCKADVRPYRSVDKLKTHEQMVEQWQTHVDELRLFSPRAAKRRG